MKVLVIPEDFRKDEWMLKPILRAMFAELGSPTAQVEVCKDPLIGGIGEALKWERIEEVVQMYPMVDLFLLVVDRDAMPGRMAQVQRLEQLAQATLQRGRAMLGAVVWQEIEAWVLAGMDDLPPDWRWEDIRREEHCKEAYFLPYAKGRGVHESPGQGRKLLGERASKAYRRIRSRCPEDLGQLEARIRHWAALQDGGTAASAVRVREWLAAGTIEHR